MMHLSCFIFFLIWVPIFTQAHPVEDSTPTVTEDPLDLDLTPDSSFDASGSVDDSGDTKVLASTDTNTDSSLSTPSSVISTEDIGGFDSTKVTTDGDSERAEPVQNSPNNAHLPYAVAQASLSLFNPTPWMLKGVEVIFGTASSILNTIGDALTAGVFLIRGVTIYYIRTVKRTHNGNLSDGLSLSDGEVRSLIENYKCQDPGGRFLQEKVCKKRLVNMKRNLFQINHFTPHAPNVFHVYRSNSQEFNTDLVDVNLFPHLVCYCCDWTETDDADETERKLNGKDCTVALFT